MTRLSFFETWTAMELLEVLALSWGREAVASFQVTIDHVSIVWEAWAVSWFRTQNEMRVLEMLPGTTRFR